eukprot:1845959-Rhodomonas_salina.1
MKRRLRNAAAPKKKKTKCRKARCRTRQPRSLTGGNGWKRARGIRNDEIMTGRSRRRRGTCRGRCPSRKR